jgi:phasin family protein
MQTQFMEIYCAGLKNTADLMQASLENAQRASRELAQARTLDEWMAVQTRFTNQQLERMVDYWNRMLRVPEEASGSLIQQATAAPQERKERKTA